MRLAKNSGEEEERRDETREQIRGERNKREEKRETIEKRRGKQERREEE